MQIIAIGLWSVLAFADMAEKLEQVNQTGKAQTDCTSCSQVAAGKEQPYSQLIKQCIRQVCPMGNYTIDLYAAAAKKYAEPNAIYDGELFPVIEQTVREEIQGLIDEMPYWKKYLENPADITDPASIRTYNLLGSYAELNKLVFDGEGDEIKINIEKSRKKLTQLSAAEFRKLVDRSNYILEKSHFKIFSTTDVSHLHVDLKKEFEPKIRKSIDDLVAKFQQLKNDPNMKILTDLVEYGADLEKIKSISPANATPDDIKSINSFALLLGLISDAARVPKYQTLFDSPPIDIKVMAEEKKIGEVLDQSKEKHQKLLAAPYKNDQCRWALEMSEDLLSSQTDIDAFRPKVSSLKNQFFEKTKGLVCDETEYKKFVGSWKAVFQQSKESNLKNLKEALVKNRESRQAKRIERAPKMQSKEYSNLFGVALASGKSDSTDAGTEDICKNFVPSVYNDASNGNELLVGGLTIKNRNALGIMFHEMGHKLMGYINTQKGCPERGPFYRRLSDCLSGLHKDGERPIGKSGAVQYGALITEDFADMVSALAEPKTSNALCELLSVKSENKVLDTHSLIGDQSDTHGSYLFRALFANFNKVGSVPQVCTKALEKKEQSPNFKDCIPKE